MTQPKNGPIVNLKSEDGMRMKAEMPANFKVKTYQQVLTN
jgi:hypothetical protein